MLEWFIKFGQADIEGASPEEKNRWAAEARAMMSEGIWRNANYKRFEDKVEFHIRDKYPQNTISAVVEAHSLFAEMFFKITGSINQALGSSGSRIEKLEELGGKPQSKDYYPQLPAQIVEADRTADKLLGSLYDEKLRELRKTLDDVCKKIEANLRVTADLYDLYQNPVIKTQATVTKPGALLQVMFLKLLDEVPLRSFMWCPECGQMFIHATKRKRLYCSNLCAARRGGRENRSRLKIQRPKVYQKQKREGAARARKSYEKKLRDQGIKGKPERRPYKHKED